MKKIKNLLDIARLFWLIISVILRTVKMMIGQNKLKIQNQIPGMLRSCQTAAAGGFALGMIDLNSQFSILNSQFSILNSQFSILNSQFSKG